MKECIQGERFAVLETNYKTMAEKLTKIEDKIDSIEDKIDQFHARFDTFAEKLEDKFVMRTEFKVAIGVLSTMGLIMSLVAYLSK